MKSAWWRLPLGVASVVACAGRAPESRSPTPRPTATPAPSPAAAAATLDEMLRSDMAPHRGIPWLAGRPLRWSDFQGTPPQGGEEAAKTAYGIYYAWKCRGGAFEFRVVAAFHPRESWVQAAVLGDSSGSPRVLAHEQTHLNIAELYAQRLRAHFRQVANPCHRSDTDLAMEAQRLVDEEKAMQRRYDAETGHGLRRREQAEWEAEIARRLHVAGE